jgi:predicted component of type VI protein secretion system
MKPNPTEACEHGLPVDVCADFFPETLAKRDARIRYLERQLAEVRRQLQKLKGAVNG